MKTEKLLALAQEKTGIKQIGLLKKTARILHNMGSDVSDVLGWDVIVRAENGTCYEYYVAQPPLIGMTQPQPNKCPLGLCTFLDYKVDIKSAIEIFHSQNGGDKFVSIELCWPLVYPPAAEPHWYFVTNLGNQVTIGANSGQINSQKHQVVLYMAKAD